MTRHIAIVLAALLLPSVATASPWDPVTANPTNTKGTCLNGTGGDPNWNKPFVQPYGGGQTGSPNGGVLNTVASSSPGDLCFLSGPIYARQFCKSPLITFNDPYNTELMGMYGTVANYFNW